jgi:DNA-binding beta-propeller fold protein YncE
MNLRRCVPAALTILTLTLTAASSVPTLLPPVFLAKWGTSGPGDTQFNAPTGVAVDPAGSVYVTDTQNHRVQKFDRDGNFMRMWGWGVDTGASSYEICTIDCQAGISGSGAGQFDSPVGIAVDTDNFDVYIGDTGNRRVQRFSGNGSFLSKWGDFGTTGNRFKSPRGVAVDPSGYVYVADRSNHRISKFTNGGAFVRTWGWGVLDGTPELQTCAFAPLCLAGISGNGDGQLNAPDGIGLDASGNVYVADTLNHRIQKFDGNGAFLTKWGSNGTGDGQFNVPSAVAPSPTGDIYAGGGALSRIQIFDSSGTFLAKFGASGAGDGEFAGASDVAVSALGDIYVVDWGNNRVQKFGGPWLEIYVGDNEQQQESR